MSIKFIYKCPYRAQCKYNKKCHVLTTKTKLTEPLDMILYCKPDKKELDLRINPEEYEKI